MSAPHQPYIRSARNARPMSTFEENGRRQLLLADRVWDGVAPAPVERGFVLTDGAAIVAVGRQAELGSIADGAIRVELPGATLMPGLINAHVHMTFSASRSVVADYEREAAQGLCALALRAAGNLTAAARVGVTTVRDLGTLDEVAFAVRDAVADGRVLGPRVLASGRPITVTGGHCHWFSHHCDTAAEVRVAVREQVARGADVIKIFASGGHLTPRTNPYAPQFERDALDVAVAEARRLGVPITAHAHSTAAIRLAVTAGVGSVEHASFETMKGIDFDPALADAMAAAGIAFCPTVGDSFRWAPKDEALMANPVAARFVARLPGIYSAFRALLAAGVPLLAGSDAGVTVRRFEDYPADLAVLAGSEEVGLSVRQALVAATSGAADLMGLADAGRLEPGRRADVLAVTGDPLRRIEDLMRTRYVLVGGRPVPPELGRG